MEKNYVHNFRVTMVVDTQYPEDAERWIWPQAAITLRTFVFVAVRPVTEAGAPLMATSTAHGATDLSERRTTTRSRVITARR